MSMESRSKILCLVKIYLLLSVHPIQAARIRAAQNAGQRMGATNELVKELRKAINDHRMEQTQASNHSSGYVGETWASCAQRKDDFERRSSKFEKMYSEAQKDKEVSITETGWLILKARSLSMTLSTSEKQGCEWVKRQKEKGGADLSHLETVIQDAKGSVPCHAEASASFQNKTDISEGDIVNAFGILFSKDCKQQVFESAGDVNQLAREEAEEKREEQVAGQLAGQLGSTSLLQANRLMGLVHGATSELVASPVITIHAGPVFQALATWAMFYVVTFIWFTLICLMVGILYAAILGIIYCVLATIMNIILKILVGGGEDGYEPDFLGCGKSWLGSMHEARHPATAVCAAGSAVVAVPFSIASAVQGSLVIR